MIDSFLFTDFIENIDLFTTMNMKSTITFSSIAWSKIMTETIKNCFDEAFYSKKEVNLNNESNLIVNEDVAEEILGIVLNEDNESLFQGEGYYNNNESIEINSRVVAVEAIKRIELLKKDMESLSPDILKSFYEFRMEFVKELKKKYAIRSKFTDFFS